MDEIISTNGENHSNNNVIQPSRKSNRVALAEQDGSNLNAKPPLNNLVAAATAAAGLALRPGGPHSAYMNSIASLHHGVCH